jgi:4'-phosphopantetheinyl transferase
MIQVYYAYTDILQDTKIDNFIARLSSKTKSKLFALKRKEDRDLLIISSILLSKLLKDSGNNGYKLTDMQYSATGRPFFEGSSFDFNISHTDCCATVAFAENQIIGIDIEKIKEIDLADFENIFPKNVWDRIHASSNKNLSFYHYWTLMESALKADGRGLSLISSNKIQIRNNHVLIDGKEWFPEHLSFDPTISCCITSNRNMKAININNMISI